MKKFSENAAAVLNRENLQVINSDIWRDLQDPMKLRCEFYWLDEHDNQVTIEVPLYAVRRAYDKIGHGCCINLVCPSGAFIPSAIHIDVPGAIHIDKDKTLSLDLPYESLILNNKFNVEALNETNIIVTEREIIAAEREIVKTIQ